MPKIEPKREMTLTAAELETLKDQVWAMPFIDRVCLLSGSIIERKRESVAATHGLIEITCRLAAAESTEKRIVIAELMRTAADILEREPQDGEPIVA